MDDIEQYTRMQLIRHFEDRCEELYRATKVRGSLHLYSGQEAVAVGACAELGPVDKIAVTYRNHGWVLARGADPRRLFAEIFGRSTGCARGQGGSKHLGDWQRGVFPGNAIVGATVPLAAGAALAARNLRDGSVAVATFGDGATSQGVFHESLSMASIWKLPVVFICENNRYAEFTPADRMNPASSYAARGLGYGMETAVCNGMDVTAVRDAVRQAVDRARDGAGPTFIEAETYRLCGHMTGDGEQYRTDEERAHWAGLDPITQFEHHLLDTGLASKDDLIEATEKARNTVDDAVEAAWNDPLPGADEPLLGVLSPTWKESA